MNPRNVTLLNQHALLWGISRRFPEALRKLDQVLDITPDDPQIAANRRVSSAEPNHPLFRFSGASSAQSKFLQTPVEESLLDS